jgi:hypothetical protein
MNASIQPLQLLLVSVAGWMDRRQQEFIEYIVEENRVIKEQALLAAQAQGCCALSLPKSPCALSSMD